MDLEVIQLKSLQDNYIYLLKFDSDCIVIDPAESLTPLKYCQTHSLNIRLILNTHHHQDHVAGIAELKTTYSCAAYGPGLSPQKKLFDQLLFDQFIFNFFNIPFTVYATPGHTRDHIVYYLKDYDMLFCGDVLFSMGCGRVFEGTHLQMWESLQKIKNLPKQTQIYCAHEYTLHNALFANSLFPENQFINTRLEAIKVMREQNMPTVPFSLEAELSTNPFLLAKNEIEFKEYRIKKDKY